MSAVAPAASERQGTKFGRCGESRREGIRNGSPKVEGWEKRPGGYRVRPGGLEGGNWANETTVEGGLTNTPSTVSMP